MMRILQRFWQVNWAEQWQYRANMLMYLAYWLVSPVVYLTVWSAVANAQGDVRGLTAQDFVTYYMTMLVVDVLTSEITIHIFGYRIQDGTLSSELLRPVHPMFTVALANNLAFKVLTFGGLVPIWLILFFLVRPDYSTVTLQSALLTLPALVLGFGISFLIGAIVTSLAFWTTKLYALADFVYAWMMLLSGQFVPLQLMPPVIQGIAQALPFQLIRYFPVQLFLNKLPPDAIVRNFALGLGWFAVLLVGFQLIWRAGVRRFSAVGA